MTPAAPAPLVALDWAVVLAVLGVALVLSVWKTGRGTRNTSEFFLAGRSTPWWLLGTSMVATTFAADTPLAITEFVRTQGLWRNWYWWAGAVGHVLAVFVFARLWRRARVVTDNELIELRYSGRPAAALRMFKAAYFALLVNFIVMSWVINAMVTVLQYTVGLDPWRAVAACCVLALVYSTLAGYWGVLLSDFFQFGVAMAGCVTFAVLCVSKVGGLAAFHEKLAALPAGRADMLPAWDHGSFLGSPAFTVVVFLGFLWWSNHGADGGGYFIQRMSSARNERDAALGTLWFCVWHYTLRFWPWAVVALFSLVVLPDAALPVDAAGRPVHKAAYVLALNGVLGPGLRGLMLVTFLAAFISTISTHLNWGASYVVHDMVRRFGRRELSERAYVRLSQVVSVALMAAAGVVALYLTSIERAWIFVWSMGAGVGAVLVLRWFWWRINAWSEITALATSVLVTLGLEVLARVQAGDAYQLLATPPRLWGVPMGDAHRVLIVVPLSVAAWLSVTLLTRPEPLDRLQDFYLRVRPGGWWGPVVRVCGEAPDRLRGRALALRWVGGVALIYGSMFAVGGWILGAAWTPWAALAAAVGGAVVWVGLAKDAQECLSADRQPDDSAEVEPA